MHLLHDIPAGTKDAMNVIVECPRNSKNKYEIDKESGIIALDRVLHTAQDYPIDYGFVPQTHWDDGDALDVLILSTHPFVPGVMVTVRPVGVLKMIDGGENDFKVLGVPVSDPRFADVKELKDVNEHTLKEIRHFFETYKTLQNKEVVIEGFGERIEAEEAFERACQMYEKKQS